MSKLTVKQQRFIEEYLIDLNATQAAIRSGYSEKTAQEQGSRLLSNVKVAKAIAEGKDKRSAETKIDAAWVLTELAKQYRKADGMDDNKNALSALSHLGKHVNIQAFRDKLEVEGSVNMTILSGIDAPPGADKDG